MSGALGWIGIGIVALLMIYVVICLGYYTFCADKKTHKVFHKTIRKADWQGYRRKRYKKKNNKET